MKKEQGKAKEQARVEAAAVACCQARAGIGSADLIDAVQAAAHVGEAKARVGIAGAITAGRIRREDGKGYNQKHHYAVEQPKPESVNGTVAAEPDGSLQVDDYDAASMA